MPHDSAVGGRRYPALLSLKNEAKEVVLVADEQTTDHLWPMFRSRGYNVTCRVIQSSSEYAGRLAAMLSRQQEVIVTCLLSNTQRIFADALPDDVPAVVLDPSIQHEFQVNDTRHILPFPSHPDTLERVVRTVIEAAGKPENM